MTQEITSGVPGDRAACRFAAVLTPHRSLSPRGFVIVMTALGGISFVAGTIFYAIGAWPVMGFFGLDVLLVYIAFRLNYRSGRNCEIVELRGGELTVRRFTAARAEQSWTVNSYWARIKVVESAGYAHELRLVSHGRHLVLGDFLTLDEKRDFAAALGRVLEADRERPFNE